MVKKITEKIFNKVVEIKTFHSLYCLSEIDNEVNAFLQKRPSQIWEVGKVFKEDDVFYLILERRD